MYVCIYIAHLGGQVCEEEGVVAEMSAEHMARAFALSDLVIIYRQTVGPSRDGPFRHGPALCSGAHTAMMRSCRSPRPIAEVKAELMPL